MGPPIVVAAYERPTSLLRLLHSLAAARVPEGTRLIISIDHSEDAAESVRSAADGFSWPYGEKDIVEHSQRLGLKEHILRCGDLSQTYGAVIVLEDDLFVSPEFYQYALAAITVFQNDARIGGISLYSHRFNETAQLGFCPIEDGADCYFMQIASSWGQCWTSAQWLAFRNWYDHSHQDSLDRDYLPSDVLGWPDTSWKKHFIRYLVASDRYFVYPRSSLTTNFMERGVHHAGSQTYLQVPLLMAPKEYQFVPLESSLAVYDSHCEILPANLKKMDPVLAEYEFEVDLYGRKDLTRIQAPYMLTARRTHAAEMRFGLLLKPHELNVVRRIAGTELSLARKEDCEPAVSAAKLKQVSFYYALPERFIAGPQQALAKAVSRLKALEARPKAQFSLRTLARRLWDAL